ncbi:MAG: hypothetical protein K8F31_05175 [Roseovarius sp.]|nr:hypothetical protein [Roseovarius sp.]
MLNTGFTRSDKPFPESEVSMRFYFRETALPEGENIFNQEMGEIFEIPSTPYNADGDDVIYYETFPPNKGWIPTNYSGKVSILEDDLVEFDLTFTDGVESRRVLATFVFKMLDLVQEVGECG